MIRLLFPFVWGAGDGSTPPPPVTEGPYWISGYHAITPRFFGPVCREIIVSPGRIWAEDRTLQTFAWFEDEA